MKPKPKLTTAHLCAYHSVQLLYTSALMSLRKHNWLCKSSLMIDDCPSDCTVASGVVVVVGVCNRSQMRTSKCTYLNFGLSIGLDPS